MLGLGPKSNRAASTLNHHPAQLSGPTSFLGRSITLGANKVQEHGKIDATDRYPTVTAPAAALGGQTTASESHVGEHHGGVALGDLLNASTKLLGGKTFVGHGTEEVRSVPSDASDRRYQPLRQCPVGDHHSYGTPSWLKLVEWAVISVGRRGGSRKGLRRSVGVGLP